MEHPFSFGFSSDDIDVEDEDMHLDDDDDDDAPRHVPRHVEDAAVQDAQTEQQLVEASLLDLDEMLSLLPSSLAYSTPTAHPWSSSSSSSSSPSSPLSKAAAGARPPGLPRRELFDIRAQLMAEEEDPSRAAGPSIAGLSADDLRPRVYEGGFKTWECSVDLAALVRSRLGLGLLGGAGEWSVVELGAGTALPACTLFAHLLSIPALSSSSFSPRRTAFVLADYNVHVLTHATLPNLLLTWASRRPVHEPWTLEGDLAIDASMLAAFRADLAARNISLAFIAGAWGPRFVDLVRAVRVRSPAVGGDSGMPSGSTLLLGSETIYSPTSLRAFASVTLDLLRDAGGGEEAQALVAAKKVYFGVGGGVDEFRRAVEDMGGSWVNVLESGQGVGRCIDRVLATGAISSS